VRESRALKIMAAVLLVALLIFMTAEAAWPSEPDQTVTMKEVGKSLFEDYYVPFVILSLLLVAAMLGSVFLAKERDE
jgi:NADH:ubiquinone oxidoreductase subunit 6 (subunit J)